MGGPRGYYANLSKSEKDMPYDFTCMWSLTNKEINKQKPETYPKSMRANRATRGQGVKEMDRGEGGVVPQLWSEEVIGIRRTA